MYRANALNRFRFSEMMHGIPISSIAPWGAIGSGSFNCEGGFGFAAVFFVVIVSVDPLRLIVDALPADDTTLLSSEGAAATLPLPFGPAFAG
jgi:hypothetical protein